MENMNLKICIYSNEDLAAANPETAESQGHSA